MAESGPGALAALRRFLPRRWREPAPVVAVLRLSGVIGGASPLRRGLSMERAAGAIERAFRTRRAVAVALVLNSPGGAPAQSHLLMRRIRALAVEKNLPVFAFVEDVAASGGYMIACAADEIFADPTSILGSIGVVSASFGLDRLIERFGIERRVHTAGRSKAMLDPFQPERPEDVAHLAALQAEIHALFIALVKERRGARLAGEDEDLFSGAFWTGAESVRRGLADGLGDVRSVLRARYGDRVRLRTVALERGLFARRFAGLSADDVLAAVQARAIWSRFGL